MLQLFLLKLKSQNRKPVFLFYLYSLSFTARIERSSEQKNLYITTTLLVISIYRLVRTSGQLIIESSQRLHGCIGFGLLSCGCYTYQQQTDENKFFNIGWWLVLLLIFITQVTHQHWSDSAPYPTLPNQRQNWDYKESELNFKSHFTNSLLSSPPNSEI